MKPGRARPPLAAMLWRRRLKKPVLPLLGCPTSPRSISRFGRLTGRGMPAISANPLKRFRFRKKGCTICPVPGPVLGGAIAGKVLLTAEKNPFTVFSDIEVKAGSVLYLEPGVELQFAPDTALIVDGGDILAFGRTGLPIRFVSKTGSNGPGAWRGVFMKGAGKALLSGVWIDGADVGSR
jgi:hypothetical protein